MNSQKLNLASCMLDLLLGDEKVRRQGEILCFYKVQTKSNEVSYQESVNGHIKVNGLVNDQFYVGEIEQHGKVGVEKGINHILHISQRLKICKQNVFKILGVLWRAHHFRKDSATLKRNREFI